MIRSVKILLNNKFSGSTEAKNSNNFVLLNGQYVHVQYLGGGVVDQHNVRTFLNDENNALIINNFVSYIQQTYSNEESQTILYDDIMFLMIFTILQYSLEHHLIKTGSYREFLQEVHILYRMTGDFSGTDISKKLE